MIDIYQVYFYGLPIAYSMNTDEKAADAFTSQVSYLIFIKNYWIIFNLLVLDITRLY